MARPKLEAPNYRLVRRGSRYYVRWWEDGEWKETDPLTVNVPFDFAECGVKDMYLMYHEELESLVENLHGLKRIRFWIGNPPTAPVAGSAVTAVAVGMDVNSYHATAEAGAVNMVVEIPESSTIEIVPLPAAGVV